VAEVLAEALRETIRVQDGRLPLLDRHLARLAAGGCGLRTLECARAAAEEAAAMWSAPYGRMSLVVSAEGVPTAEVTARASVIDVAGGPRIALVTVPEPHLPPGAAKPADRSQWDRAFALLEGQGADVAVLVSGTGLLMDTSHATLWIRSGQHLLTPPSPPALAGVSRGVVFDTATALGYAPAEAPLTPADLDAADEILLTTAVAGARAVHGHGGPASEALFGVFERLFFAGR
jgi:branched-subunit amino acid aminotransferase/4-amino-4-deoxychorismate lyase